jgi:hypothetical protein
MEMVSIFQGEKYETACLIATLTASAGGRREWGWGGGVRNESGVGGTCPTLLTLSHLSEMARVFTPS